MAQEAQETDNGVELNVEEGPSIVQPERGGHQLHCQLTHNIVAALEAKRHSEVMRALLCGMCIPVDVIALSFFAAFKYKDESDRCSSHPLRFFTIFIVTGCIGIVDLFFMCEALYCALSVKNRDMIKAKLYSLQGRHLDFNAAFESGQKIRMKGVRINLALDGLVVLHLLFSIAGISGCFTSLGEGENCTFFQQWWIGLLFVSMLVQIGLLLVSNCRKQADTVQS
ncbi:unnamed protein product [Polarella glacialis]|uniref:Uncharacterized protein n=1 Tax=Polarella glacialis TaxID=89957 RepID=A0A813JEJ6_POLGL|nr:unnamed protein product [Polarella glacialis]